jgi:hypothetical protein
MENCSRRRPDGQYKEFASNCIPKRCTATSARSADFIFFFYDIVYLRRDNDDDNDDNNNSEHYHLRQNVTTIILSDYSNCDGIYNIYIYWLILLHYVLLSLYICIVSRGSKPPPSVMHALCTCTCTCTSSRRRWTKNENYEELGKKHHVNNSLLPWIAITSNDSILYNIFVPKQIFAYCRRQRL